MRTQLLIALAVGMLLACINGVSRAGVFDPSWESAVVVDSGAIDISSSSGSAMEHTPGWTPWSARDEWHIVYSKGGEIEHAVLLPSGWQSPEALTNDPANSHDPKIAFARDRLIVVWEDDRRGHPEIWCRMWDGASWGDEIGLTDDATPSQLPVIAGGPDDSYVVWQEGTAGHTQIQGRLWNGISWGAVEAVSSSPAYAIGPTVTTADYYEYVIAWADGRNGATEIYLAERSYDGLGPRVRVTDLAGSCRRPSVHSEDCCGDMIMPHALIAFENDQDGQIETWTACYEFGSVGSVMRFSPNDGRASERPQIHGYGYTVDHELGGVYPRYLLTWTDAGNPGAKRHPLGLVFGCASPDTTEILSTIGFGTSAIAGIEGRPNAGLLAAWLEEREGVRSLIVKRASILGCEGFTFGGPSAIVLAPEGLPSNTMTCRNQCSGGSPVEGVEMRMTFSETLAGHLTWDASQAHPELPPQTTGSDGSAIFAIRGGGCWPEGTVSLRFNGVEVREWQGAKSPDVDGDCAVQMDDLAYVSSKVGTTDFCADLDGSGTVTQADVAIVEAALGDLCSQLAAIDGTASAGPTLQIRPNPSRGEVTLEFATGDRGPIDVEIFDAAGRVVRAWPGITPTGANHALTWDGRDAMSRRVASGVYFVRVTDGASLLLRTLLIAR
jgi:hypothetical protein